MTEIVLKAIQLMQSQSRYTLDEIMDLMKENTDGKMEFPRDIAMQDCFSGTAEPLYGFVTNVTLVEDMPCLLGIECFENGTTIKANNIELEGASILEVNMGNDSHSDFVTQQITLLDRVCGPEDVEAQNRRKGNLFK